MSVDPVIVLTLFAIALFAYFIWNQQGTNRQMMENTATQRLTSLEYEAQYMASTATHFLLDVRTPQEFREGHIPGAVNIELDGLANRLAEIPRDEPVVVYCRSGRRSQMAAQILAQAGFTNITDLGGIVAWQRQGLPVQ